MSALKSLSRAMFLGYIRDRMTVFWSVLFPLMFLVLFGGIFTDNDVSRLDVAQVGAVAVLDHLPAEASKSFGKSVEITKVSSTNEDAEIAKVRKGDRDAVVVERDNKIVVYYSAAEQVSAARVVGTFQGLVDSANIAVSGVRPIFTMNAQKVEDDSLKAIQYVTPSLLGWAVAMSATFGAATNLVAWRKSGLLRRLRLAPIPTSSVVGARVGVSMLVALVQAAIFVGLGTLAFGLKLSGAWPLMIPLLMAGTLSFLSIGMLAGSISKTEEGAVGLANFIVLPMAFLSGSFFPLDGAPRWLQVVSNLLPLKHLNSGMLDVMVRGEGFSAIIEPIGILLGFAAVFAAISAALFRWDA